VGSGTGELYGSAYGCHCAKTTAEELSDA